MATIQQQVLANLCVMAGEKRKRLFEYVTPEYRDVVTLLAKRWQGEGREQAIARIQQLVRLENFSLLREIHPGWFLEKMGQAPRILSALKTYLSEEQNEYLLHHLSPGDRVLFHQTAELDPALRDQIRSLVEARLGVSGPIRVSGEFCLQHLVLMKEPDLRTLYRELGLREIAKAFSEVDPKVLKTFLSRFSVATVQEIRWRLEQASTVSAQERTQAQSQLVALSLNPVPTERFFDEIGCSVLARAIAPAEREAFEIIPLRMKPEEGYRFKRMMNENVIHPDEVVRAQQQVLKAVMDLAEQGGIQKFWRQQEELTVDEIGANL